ncbi:MAG: VirB3 family type IV secretion system protein [Fusobacterium necrophorum]|nr:VirB3 family type IV secretion system protein [Fusobacterium necrophorum]
MRKKRDGSGLEAWRIPVYQAFTKDLMMGGIPLNMAILILAFIFFSVFILHNLYIALIFLFLYFLLFLTVKFSKKFDTKIIDIIVRMSIKKYIDY